MGYRSYFQSADPVWNVTGSGGTNLKCLAAHAEEEWKCLMAPYIAEHIETPLFVMNSGYDAWQMEHILQTQCIPAPNRGPCSADQNATMQSFHDKFVKDIASVTDGKPKNGVYVDSCYVHEQNVNYCSNQGMPNCVGWSPLETGSKKWGYNTTVKVGDGRSLTPQQAFGAYYRGDRVAAVAVDEHSFFDNPGCFYLGQPVPPACDWHLHVGFNVAEQSCFVGDWRRSPSCRRDSKWTTFLVNYEGATWESNHASVALI